MAKYHNAPGERREYLAGQCPPCCRVSRAGMTLCSQSSVWSAKCFVYTQEQLSSSREMLHTPSGAMDGFAA